MSISVLPTNLNSRYEYQLICSKKSIAIFDAALECGFCPSRFSIAVNLMGDIASCPFYLICKIAFVAHHFFSFLFLNTHRTPLTVKLISHLIFLSSLQFLFPLVCTVIRIASSSFGLIIPLWAIKGWRLAEKGEELAHQIIVQHWQASILSSPHSNQEEEIHPSSALFYLGWNQTHEIAHSSALLANKAELEEKIRLFLSNFLREISENDLKSFQKLLKKDQAVEAHSYFGDEHILDQYILLLLNKMEQGVQAFKETCQETAQETDSNAELIRFAANQFSLEEMQQLFYYISLNLQHGFLGNKFPCLNQTSLKAQIKDLNNLFSYRLKFGRACYLT
ncbi:hypothetical protein [Candidatus Protochlamydia phocaeensis]|uniref:hypothetical protein n=1 Tax=Candidatus Protochlamydia phocaeensis TaxID=1414722 RepID=UPI00083803BB|nr:hypothetical protein [Candidatus Protochlamydia phocaeensis]